MAVVVDEAHLAELVHEMAHPRTSRDLAIGELVLSAIGAADLSYYEVPALVAQTGTVPRARIKKWQKRQQRSGECTQWLCLRISS